MKMKANKTNFLLLILLFLSMGSGFSQKFSNEFLKIGIGARAQAMSGAVTAYNPDVNAGYWNPAMMSGIAAPFQAGAMHANIFGGVVKYDNMMVGKRLNADNGSFGAITLIRMAVDDIPNTLSIREPDGSINYDNIRSFSVSDYAMLISYAKSIFGDPNLRLGGNAKLIHRRIGSFGQGWGLGVDLGVQWVMDNYMFGAMLRDATTTFTAWTYDIDAETERVLVNTGNDVPESSVEITLPSLTLGGAGQFKLNNKSKLLAALDVELNTDGQKGGLIAANRFAVLPKLGLEYSYADKVFIRGGVGRFQLLKTQADAEKRALDFQPTAGVGVKLGRIHIDYAFSDIGNASVLDYTHVFSLVLDIYPRQHTDDGSR